MKVDLTTHFMLDEHELLEVRDLSCWGKLYWGKISLAHICIFMNVCTFLIKLAFILFGHEIVLLEL